MSKNKAKKNKQTKKFIILKEIKKIKPKTMTGKIARGVGCM